MVRIHNPRQPPTTKSYFASLCSPTTENPESEKLKSKNFVSGKIVQTHLQDQYIKLKVTLERYNSKIIWKGTSPITWRDITSPRAWRPTHFLENFPNCGFHIVEEQMPSLVCIVLTCSLQSVGILLTAPGAVLIDFHSSSLKMGGRPVLDKNICQHCPVAADSSNHQGSS